MDLREHAVAWVQAGKSVRSVTQVLNISPSSVVKFSSSIISAATRAKWYAAPSVPQAPGSSSCRLTAQATSGKAVEAAGDVQTLILDKTGTITTGDREAREFLPVAGQTKKELIQAAFLASYFDTTPEGRNIVSATTAQGAEEIPGLDQAQGLDFSAHTRMSGIDLPDGMIIRKGAVSAIVAETAAKFGRTAPSDLQSIADSVARKGATPLAVSADGVILGILVLSDMLKPGIRERMQELRKMAVRTVMVTGDNPLTARTIAGEAGVDDFVAEVKPEQKLQLVIEEQRKGLSR
jgi:potassium-transporting ATPase ATP-binding subunit